MSRRLTIFLTVEMTPCTLACRPVRNIIPLMFILAVNIHVETYCVPDGTRRIARHPPVRNMMCPWHIPGKVYFDGMIVTNQIKNIRRKEGYMQLLNIFT